MAIENEVDVIGLSILSGTHEIITKRINQEMIKNNLQIPLVVGGNIPTQDVETLMKLGPIAVFATGTRVDDVVSFFLNMKNK
jgi:methylmalonyl-CoA mutase C-terminal domain/subunit